MPSSSSSLAVPPVETISTPSSASPRAKSTSPRLSETDRSALRTLTSPGATGSTPPLVSLAILDPQQPGVVGVGMHSSLSDQLDGTRQQPVLHLVDSLLDLSDPARIGNEREGLLQDDGSTVHPLVDEMDRDPHDLDAVGQRLLDGANAREGRQERRMDVHDAPREAP